ncbi:hypothetical protein D1007_11457 [Hordeum vulgare]|nr:hypothetical protein D1007_11457 [Hordeum vulgare]
MVSPERLGSMDQHAAAVAWSNGEVGDHDVNQLQIPRNSSSPQDLVIDSMPEVAFKVVLKTSTYTTKQNVAYGTIRSTDPRTKVGGLELGAEFALMRIDQPILDSEELIGAKDN